MRRPSLESSHRSRRTIVLRYPTRAYQSDTTVVDQRPPPHRLAPIKRRPPRHKTGAAFTCLLTNHAYISVDRAAPALLGDGRFHRKPPLWSLRRVPLGTCSSTGDRCPPARSVAATIPSKSNTATRW